MADERLYPRNFEVSHNVSARHMRRYLDAIELLDRMGKDEIWLDLACGSGYGSALLYQFASAIIGCDICDKAISYARANYQHGKLFYTKYPNGHAPFDAAFCIETIEHIPRDEAAGFLQKLSKLMKDDGDLIMCTPMPKHSNPSPVNRFHKYEYCASELKDVLSEAGFELVNWFFQPVQMTDGESKMQGFFKCRK